MSSVVIARELDNTQFTIENGSYQFSKIIQQTGGQTFTISGGGTESIFDLPPKLYNLPKCVLSYTMTPTAAVGAVNYIPSGTLSEIRSIQLYTRSGMFLCDIQDVNNYLETVLRRETKRDEMLNNDVPASGSGYWEGLHVPKVSPLLLQDTANAANATTLQFFNTLVPPLGAVQVDKLTSPAYYTAGTAQNSATPVITRKFPLSVFVNSILSLDKDLYFGGETVQLRIIWEDCRKSYFKATQVTDASTAAAAGTQMTISGLTLYAAVETNQVVENKIKDNIVGGGMNILIPYVKRNKINLTGTSQTIQVKYTRAQGSRLQKIYWAPYNDTESTNTAFDHTNVAGSKITTFRITINGTNPNIFDPIIANGDDYMMQSHKLKGSCIQSSLDYYRNWTWCEDFCNNYNLIDKPLMPPEQNYIDGLDLEIEKIIMIEATTAGNPLNHYVFSVAQKNLIIDKNGIQLL